VRRTVGLVLVSDNPTLVLWPPSSATIERTRLTPAPGLPRATGIREGLRLPSETTKVKSFPSKCLEPTRTDGGIADRSALCPHSPLHTCWCATVTTTDSQLHRIKETASISVFALNGGATNAILRHTDEPERAACLCFFVGVLSSSPGTR